MNYNGYLLDLSKTETLTCYFLYQIDTSHFKALSLHIWFSKNEMRKTMKINVRFFLSEDHKPEEDVFMDDDEVPKEEYLEDVKDKDGGWTEVKDTAEEEPTPEDNEAIAPDETIHEAPVGKGLSSALKLLKDRGTLKESIEWGGRNMDKRKSKLVGIVDEDEPKESKSKDSRLSSLVDYKKEIHIERTDEFGRIVSLLDSIIYLAKPFIFSLLPSHIHLLF